MLLLSTPIKLKSGKQHYTYFRSPFHYFLNREFFPFCDFILEQPLSDQTLPSCGGCPVLLGEGLFSCYMYLLPVSASLVEGGRERDQEVALPFLSQPNDVLIAAVDS